MTTYFHNKIKYHRQGIFGLLILTLIFMGGMFVVSKNVRAATITVSTNAQLDSALSAANPGDIIIMTNGTYLRSSGITLTRSGTSAAPITLRAANPGQAIIKFSAGAFNVHASWWILQNFEVNGDGKGTGNGGITEGLLKVGRYDDTIEDHYGNITIEGVTIRDSAGAGFTVRPGAFNVTFRNGLISGTGYGGEYGEAVYIGQGAVTPPAVYTGPPVAHNILFENSIVEDFTENGPDIKCNSRDVIIRGNIFRTQTTHAAHGSTSVRQRSLIGAAGLSNAIIENNQFLNNNAGDYLVDYGFCGGSNTIRNNTFDNDTVSSILLRFSGSLSGTAIFTGNRVTNSNNNTIGTFPASATVTITGNCGINYPNNQLTCSAGSPTPTPTGSTLSATLSANPSTGTAPLNTTLSSTVTGSSGTINYSFWWNCSNTSNIVSTVSTACGALPAPANGTCSSNTVGYKCNGVNTNPQSIAHSYATTGTSTAKVIVERGSSAPDEARTTITVGVVPTISIPPLGVVPTLTIPPLVSPTLSPPPRPSPLVTVVPDTTPPSVPTGLTATATSARQVRLNWTASTDNVAVTGYKIYRSSSPQVFIGTAATNTFIDNTVIPNVRYTYNVSAYDAAGNDSAQSAPAIVNTPLALSTSWRTPLHAYPLADFTWVPTNPAIGATVNFTDATTYFDSAVSGSRFWSWIFCLSTTCSTSDTSTLQNPSSSWPARGIYNVTQYVIDRSGYACAQSRLISVQESIPVWKEVSPK